MGVVVRVPTPSPSGQNAALGEVEEAVVGVCAAAETDKPLAALKVHGLASPDWQASKELLARHYPAGTEAAGVWLRREKEEDREQIISHVQLLINHTGLKVG